MISSPHEIQSNINNIQSLVSSNIKKILNSGQAELRPQRQYFIKQSNVSIKPQTSANPKIQRLTLDASNIRKTPQVDPQRDKNKIQEFFRDCKKRNVAIKPIPINKTHQSPVPALVSQASNTRLKKSNNTNTCKNYESHFVQNCYINYFFFLFLFSSADAEFKLRK